MTATLSELLEQQLQCLQELSTLQDDERAALEQRDAPALEQLTVRKTELLRQLELNDKAVAEHPQRGVVATHPDLQKKRAEIQQALEHVQQQNEVNGQLVRLTLGRIQNLRQTLQAMHSDGNVTYNEKGRTRAGGSGKGIKA